MSNSNTNKLPPVSKLAKLQAQFQQKQMQEKEQKLIKMFENQQQNAMQKFLPATGNGGVAAVPPGKVRQMFEERRRGGTGNLSGIDKSYPLEPLVVTPNGKSRSTSSKSDPSPSTQTRSTRNKELKVRSDTFGNGPYEVISKRGISSDGPFTSNSSSNNVPSRTVGARSANISRQYKSSLNTEDENLTNNNTSAASDRNQPPPVPTTTKYTDYTNELNSKRETTLANKLNRMQLSTPAPTPSSRKSTPSSPIRSTAPAPSVKSKTPTPVKRSGPPQPGLDECKICGRYFAPDRIQKHETICKKTKTKKRKVFDPTKMRMEGTEAEPYLRVVSAKVKKPPQAKPPQQETKKADWRKKHDEFIKTIRAAKEYQAHVARGGNPNDFAPPPPSDNSDYIQCPYCNRKFAEAAAHRHIPKCKNIKSNKR